jgi:hypothetical protein
MRAAVVLCLALVALTDGVLIDRDGATRSAATATRVFAPAARTGAASEPADPSPCDPSYPTICIPPRVPDLDCADIPYRAFSVIGDDPHGFDAERSAGGQSRRQRLLDLAAKRRRVDRRIAIQVRLDLTSRAWSAGARIPLLVRS